MADITDAEALQFSNAIIRTMADTLSSLYYECKFLSQLKTADADTATTIALRDGQIRDVAVLMVSAVYLADPVDNIWFNVGTGGTINSKIPNDAADDIIDGAPGDGRPPITGQDVHNIVSRVIDVGAWMRDAAFGGPGTGTSFDAMVNTMVVCSRSGNQPLQVAQVNTFVDNRCGEIIAEYEATSSAKLTQLLAVAPNPRNPA